MTTTTSTTTGTGHHDRRRYHVKHVTEYQYEEAVTRSFSRAMLRCRDTEHQRVADHTIEVSPTATILEESVDAFGNWTHYVEVTDPYTTLTVTKTATLDIEWPKADLDALDRWTVAEAAREVEQKIGRAHV